MAQAGHTLRPEEERGGRGALAELSEGLEEAAALASQAALPLFARELFALGFNTTNMRGVAVGGGRWDWRSASGRGSLCDDLCRFVSEGDEGALALFDTIAERNPSPVSEAWRAVRAARAACVEATGELDELREALLPFAEGEAGEEDRERLCALLGVGARDERGGAEGAA